MPQPDVVHRCRFLARIIRPRTCERDFIHVSDLACAHVAALRQLNNGGETLTLNLGTGRAYSILEIISTVERVIGRTVPVTIDFSRLESLAA